MKTTAEKWLDNEDKLCRDDRLNRLKWIMEEFPNIDVTIFHGGLKTAYLFEEARYCFVYGQYIASILLSLSYIENTLASIFYASGEDDLERARVVDLLERAKEEGLISVSEFLVFNNVRKIRNPIVHFRKPGDKETVEHKAVKDDRHPYEILEEEAKIALQAGFRMMAKGFIL